MSPGNVEVVRRIYALPAATAGLPVLDRLLEFLDPSVEWVPRITPSLTGASYRGHSGVRQWLEDTLETWDEFRPEPIDFTDAGDHVVVDVRWRARGRSSTAPVEDKVTQVWTLRAGKVVRLETFADRELALEAVGIQA